MLNNTNVIGAIVMLKQCHSMSNNTPLKVIDYTGGDGGTQYKPMILAYDVVNKISEWVLLKSVNSVISYGLPFEDKSNIKLLLKQLAL